MDFKFEKLTKDLAQRNIQFIVNLSRRNIDGEYWNEENFLVDLNQKWELSFFVLDDLKRIVAFLIASDKLESIHIHKFVVDDVVQRKGLGSLMLDHLWSKIDKPVTLKVDVNNLKAIGFYSKKGFSISETKGNLHAMIHNTK